MKVCGCNEYHQLGEKSTGKGTSGHECINTLTDSHLDADSLLSFSTYTFHTVYIKRGGHCFGLGDNRSGKISGDLPKEVFTTEREIQFQDPKGHPCKFISAVCGEEYTLYLVSIGNSSNKQLIYVHQFLNNGKPLFLDLNGRTPTKLFGGSETSAAVDQKGGIIIISSSSFETLKNPLETINLPDGDRIMSVACLNDRIYAVSSNGKLFECLLKNSKRSFNPVFEVETIKFLSVSGTFEHCFAICENGRVFCKGSNDSGQLGIRQSQRTLSKFTEISTFGEEKIVSASAGRSHSLFVSSQGKIFACGNNCCGQLLLENNKNEIYSPTETTVKNDTAFCIAGYNVTVVFFDEVPSKTPNRARIEVDEHEISIDDYERRLIEKSEEIDRLKKEVENLNNEIRRLRSNVVGKDEDENERLKEQISSKSDELKEIREENDRLCNELLKKEENEKEMKSQIEKLRSEQAQERMSFRKKDNESMQKIQKLEQELSKLRGDKSISAFLEREQIDQYEKIEELGRGASSTVFKVINKNYRALKELNNVKYTEEDNSSFDKIQSLFNELMTLSNLDDPNIIKVYGMFRGDQKSPPSILFEYCPNNLKKEITKLDNEKRVRVIIEIVKAMKTIHKVNIIHGDLKPENILLDDNYNVKLADFGILKILDPDDDQTKEAGSLDYMAPEVFDSTEYNEKVDVYSFGIILYQILMKGKKPGLTVKQKFAGKLPEIPQSVSSFSADLIKECLDIDPSKRPSFESIYIRLTENWGKILSFD